MLREKRQNDYNEKIRILLEEPIDEVFNNAEFKLLMDPLEPDSVVKDLKFKFLSKTIELAHAEKKLEEQRKTQKIDKIHSRIARGETKKALKKKERATRSVHFEGEDDA